MKKVLSDLGRFSLYLISLLPFPLLYLLSNGFYVLLYYIIGYRKEVVKTNLRNSFPQKSDNELKQIERKFFHFLADNIVESVKMLTMSKRSISKRFVFTNIDLIKGYFKQGKSVLVCGGHYANWEWGNLATPLSLSENILVVYKPLTDKAFERTINYMRSRFGTTMVPMKMILRKIIEQKNRPYFAAFVSDQTPTRDDSTYFVNFLNQPTAVFQGIEKIARATGQPVIYCHIDRVKRGYYQATFKTLNEDPKQSAEHEITEAHTRELETHINSRPELWLWSHRRWKLKPEN